jgi:hypothetical protein
MPSIFGASVNLGISTLSAEKGRMTWGSKQKAREIKRSNTDFLLIFFILIGQTMLNLHVHPLLSLMVNENHIQKVYALPEIFIKSTDAYIHFPKKISYTP